MSKCKNCDDEGWVCEAHDDMPWRKAQADRRGCDCNAGMPCAECNPCDRDNPPRMPPGFKPMFDKDGCRH